MHRISSFATLRPPTHLKRPQLVSRAFQATVSRQLRGLTTEFCSTGMPSAWGAADRRAAVSGLSGALYALPATATPFLYEKALWLAQACLSILADYVFIAEDHPVQGVDRTFASFMMVRNLSVLGPAVPRLAPLVLVPVLCFVAAAHAKTRAAKESEIPNFKGSFLGRFPLVSADFWTIDHLSERSRSVDAFSGTRARGTLTLKRR